MGSLRRPSFLWLLTYAVVLLSLILQGKSVLDEWHPRGGRTFYDSVVGSFTRTLMESPDEVVPPVAQKIDCASACAFRCSKAQEHEDCLRYCGICCGRCHCVPPGTYGNREACGPCYANWTTHGGKPKCP